MSTITIPGSISTSRDLVEAPLRQAVDRLCPSMRKVASYHMGWTDETGQSSKASGKMLRPALAVLSSQAAGATPEQGVPAAVAVELIHTFSLLHDDIMDGDRTRRHRPTAWTVFGESAAILAGDALQTLAMEVLLENGNLMAVRSLAGTTQRLIAGQALDLEFEQRDNVTLQECVEMAAGKTGALLSCSASLGAVTADASPELVSVLANYGMELGLAFQIVDDLLGIWGSPEVTGKPVLSDLRSRKKTLPIVAALEEHAPRLRQLLAQPEPITEQELQLAAQLVDEAGGRDWAETEAQRLIARAEQRVTEVAMPSHVRDELILIGRFVTARDR